MNALLQGETMLTAQQLTAYFTKKPANKGQGGLHTELETDERGWLIIMHPFSATSPHASRQLP